jgi:hypothetical protein
VLILWKKLFGKDELRPIHVAQKWPSRALVKIFVCWTILSIGYIFYIDILFEVCRVARLISFLIFSIRWTWMNSRILQTLKIAEPNKHSRLWMFMMINVLGSSFWRMIDSIWKVFWVSSRNVIILFLMTIYICLSNLRCV